MKHVAAIAGLLCALPTAAAVAQNDPPAALAKPAGHHAAARPKRPVLPVVLPHEFAPPQEAYASFPDNGAAAASAKPSACQAGLAKVATFQPLPVLVGPGDCGADDAVQLDAITLADQSKVTVIPPAILRCPMAQQVADWVRDDVAPAAQKFASGLASLDDAASYDCRSRNNVRAAKVSEHGRADALDVRDFKLADGRTLTLTDMTADKDWREAVRSGACERFMTVLGPGSDGYHEEHVHLDLEPRRNDYKICEWDVRMPPAPIVAEARPTEPAQAGQPAKAEGVPLQGLDPPLIPQNEVPLPRPRPLAATTARHGVIR